MALPRVQREEFIIWLELHALRVPSETLWVLMSVMTLISTSMGMGNWLNFLRLIGVAIILGHFLFLRQ